MKTKLNLPALTESEKSPVVIQLLSMIETQASIIGQLTEQIQLLKDEIARLKGQSPRPKIRPSQLEKKKTKKSGKKKRAGSKKRSKTVKIQIHDTIDVEPEYIPEGSTFKGYQPFVVQGLKIEPHNVCYRLKSYETPDGKYLVAKPPKQLKGKHFDPSIVCFIMYQHYQCHVTQPLLLEELHELGIDISKGQLSNILIENKDDFHREKDDILAAGLEVSSYINVDDTGARHKGKNGYCTHIGNEQFAWFESTDSKSRINFLKLLRAGRTDYWINTDAVAYMQVNKLPRAALDAVIASHATMFADDEQWHDFLSTRGIVTARHVKIATEGALVGSIVEHGISKNLVIVSDDAGQFNILRHGLCWIHANRTIDKITPFTDDAGKDLDDIKERIWDLYQGLKAYRENPTASDKEALEAQFDDIFTTRTHSQLLNLALGRIYENKSELLLVLDRPDIPLHNNTAESAIREYVKRRKISGSTRSESGRRCRDTFTSLKKTCRKLGVSFWQYLQDRLLNTEFIPMLSDLIRQQVSNPG
jgi:uncharacterized small protein (DUF1192 family)